MESLTELAERFEAPLSGVIERDNCVIFVLNSGYLCSHDQPIKHGYLSADQLQWFKNITSQYLDSAKTKIVLLHHHPFGYPFPLPGMDISILEEGSELSQICGESGIDLVLHGHRHHPKAKTVSETGWRKPVTYICAGSLSVNASHRRGGIPNTFHIVEIENPNRIILKNYEYSHTEGWIQATNYREAFPLDGKMLLGKTVDENSMKNLIKALPVNQPIKYQSFGNDLEYLYRHQLIKLIEDEFLDCTVYPKQDHLMIFKPTGGV
jgi:predicted phosphodiesterase